ncbi:MAG: 2-succinyl-6-hydroxy-2,4-cyclohexadiene-1-carboxylate synthase [Chitinophagaceae bacterium]|nr:2-succinyl-6-hydroxy-2,4-cyclohexadiene-1-carboxylate synthase [Anaerolineae bacterium]
MTRNSELNYHAKTSGEGEPLVLLHGFSGSGADWAAHLPALTPHFRVVTVDLPGHGKTDSPTDPAHYTIENMAQDLISLLESLDLGQVHLLGYSMGGRLALYLAIHYPTAIKSLILESASPGLASPEERQARIASDQALATQIEQKGLSWFADYWGNIPLFASQKNLQQAIQDDVRARRLNNNPHGLVNSLRGMGTGVQPSLWPHLSALKRPVLLLTGEHDSKFVAINQQMQTQIPDAQHIIIPDAGHTVHLEQPVLFEKNILDFLTSVKR